MKRLSSWDILIALMRRLIADENSPTGSSDWEATQCIPIVRNGITGLISFSNINIC